MPSAGTGPVRFPQRASFVLWVETIWDRDPLHPQRMCLPFIFRRVKTGIAGQQLGRPPQPLLMQAHRRQQQGRVGRPLPAHRIVGDRYHLLPGDVLEIDLGGEYGIVLLPNLLHHFEQSTCIQILQKTHRSMTEGGRLMILEFVPNEDRVTPAIPASFALMMLGVTPAGDVYTTRQLHQLLSAAGFGRPIVVPVPQSPCSQVEACRAGPSSGRQQQTMKTNRIAKGVFSINVSVGILPLGRLTKHRG